MGDYKYHMAAHEGQYEIVKDAISQNSNLVNKKDDVSVPLLSSFQSHVL